MSTDQMDLALLVLRVALGISMALHGLNKLRGGIDGTGRWFASMGMKPGVLHAWMAALTEIGTGVLLALGLLTSLAAAGMVALMLVAIVVAHRHNGFFVFRPGQGWEYCMIIAVAAFAIGTMGAGGWSLDAALDLEASGWTGALVAGILGVLAAALQLLVFYRPPKPVAG